MNELKIECFEYFITHLFKRNVLGISDFNKVKLMKLLFFFCLIEKSFLEVFDEFYAMPTGHVEADVKNAINKDKLTHYNIFDFSVSIKSDLPSISKFENSDNHYNQLIKNSIHKIPDEFLYADSNYLKEQCSHYSTWIRNYNYAIASGRYMYKISVEELKEEKFQYSHFFTEYYYERK